MAIVGEPGVGKSRIFREFTHSHRTQRWQIIESVSVSYGSSAPFLPLIELLRSYFWIETHDDARKVREKVTGKLLSLDRTLEPSLPALLWLLDTPVDDPQWQRLDPPQRRQQTLDGIKRLLLRESQVQPLLLVFEDLHWIDAESQACERDPVAPAKCSPAALAKATSRRPSDGTSAMRFTRLLAHMATIVRNTVRSTSARIGEATFTLTTRPNAKQQQALDLLTTIAV